MRPLLSVLVSAAFGAAILPGQQTPSLEDTRHAAGAYVARYQQDIPAVLMTEDYTETERDTALTVA